MPDDMKWRYIGDGVYAKYDGFGVWLHANSHDEPTDRVYLEPAVMNALVDFYKLSVEDARRAQKARKEKEDGS